MCNQHNFATTDNKTHLTGRIWGVQGLQNDMALWLEPGNLTGPGTERHECGGHCSIRGYETLVPFSKAV